MNALNLCRGQHREAGFTLVEALVALLVMAFGMLAIAGFQTTLSRNSDVAKQRSEAVRLAQQKIDELRSFVSLTGDGVGNTVDYADDLKGSADLGSETIAANATYKGITYQSNTQFLRTWTVTKDGAAAVAADGTDPQKWVSVTVEWADRTAAGPTAYNQSVTVTSVIARSHPDAIKFVQNNAGSTTSRRPKNRSINIPYPAMDFGTGKSGFAPGGAISTYFVFDNNTGLVTHRCTGATLLDPNATGANCTALTIPGYLLSGYIYWYQGNQSQLPDGLTLSLTNKNNALQEAPPLDYTLANVTTGETNAVSIQFFAPTATATKECFIQKQEVRSSTHLIAPDDAVGNNHDYMFATYLCVVQPVVVAANGTTPRWFGQLTVKMDGSHPLGTYRLCRFTGDYDGDNVLSNAEHPLYYRGVIDTLDNQNYVVMTHNCPTDTEFNPLAQPPKYTNNNTEVQQNSAAISPATLPFGGQRSTTASQWPNSGQEPATNTVEIPME